MHKIVLDKDFKELEDDIVNIKKIFDQSSTSIHKARNELKIIELQGIKCVVKSFKIPHIINKIAYTFFRDSKALKSYNNAQQLQQLQINTPQPIATIEFFENSLLTHSYFISHYEPYDFTIREVFHHKVEDLKQILKEFARFTHYIHQKGVWHVDYSLGNILITKEPSSYRFSLVDINRMKFGRVSTQEGLKNFNKFWAKFDEDLPIIASEYAKIADFDEHKATKIVLQEAKKLERMVGIKRWLKGH